MNENGGMDCSKEACLGINITRALTKSLNYEVSKDINGTKGLEIRFL